MGKKAGFGVGRFVRPETMGIWMWGKPVRMKLHNDQQVALVFLDTEGFAATNVSETYDAKVFAVATLLSSFLIYNSVKIIDQADIDYLELLSRRTQLFALKSQMSKAKWTDEFNHDLLTFPPLLWVVQDFVQVTDDQENDPSKWLHRLLASSSKDSAEHTVSLKGSPITGPEFASLLEILVDAANEGSLAQIPSRWNIFIEKLEKTAKEDCFEFYEGEMVLLQKQYDNGPVPEDELQRSDSSVLAILCR
ncbi:hypothetical protein QZH41_007511 [Actinostola sp. cb2023]|nr:hypothetical protein QZH41_007511 [Actinostola sp. cb2023]